MQRISSILALFIFSVSYIWCSAQSPVRIRTTEQIPPDSADIEYYCHPDFKRAALTVTGLNLGVWAFDRYVQKADFSRISLHSIVDNIKEGFNWDNDRLSTNMFLHPYHGNLYYNSARSNGFNYWRSGLFAFAGSAMWELILENEYPSTNDIIATPIGGMAIGEVTYRASDLLLDDRSRGSERFGREATVFLISPMRELTRIINGDAWRHRDTPGRVFGRPNIAFKSSVGVRALGIRQSGFDRGAGFSTELNIEYGDRFELRSTTPYDYFTFKINLNIQHSQPVVGQLNIMGRLISRELMDTENHDISVGMYQHYDFYDSDTLSEKSAKVPYRLGIPASVGAGIMYRGVDKNHFAIDAYAHLNAVLLGGILSDHYNLNDRNYNLASGFSVKSGVNMVFNRGKFGLSLNYDYYRMYTWGYPRNTDMRFVNPRTLNAEGDESVAFFGVGDLRTDYRIDKNLYLTATFTAYMRATRYRDFPNVNSNSFAARLMLTYKF